MRLFQCVSGDCEWHPRHGSYCQQKWCFSLCEKTLWTFVLPIKCSSNESANNINPILQKNACFFWLGDFLFKWLNICRVIANDIHPSSLSVYPCSVVSNCIYMHIRIHIYISTCKSIYTYIYVCIYTYVYICICINICMYIYVYIYVYMNIYEYIWIFIISIRPACPSIGVGLKEKRAATKCGG